jgi:hypothetical protein
MAQTETPGNTNDNLALNGMSNPNATDMEAANTDTQT